jgi:hypothetical protein
MGLMGRQYFKRDSPLRPYHVEINALSTRHNAFRDHDLPKTRKQLKKINKEIRGSNSLLVKREQELRIEGAQAVKALLVDVQKFSDATQKIIEKLLPDALKGNMEAAEFINKAGERRTELAVKAIETLRILGEGLGVRDLHLHKHERSNPEEARRSPLNAIIADEVRSATGGRGVQNQGQEQPGNRPIDVEHRPAEGSTGNDPAGGGRKPDQSGDPEKP